MIGELEEKLVPVTVTVVPAGPVKGFNDIACVAVVEGAALASFDREDVPIPFTAATL